MVLDPSAIFRELISKPSTALRELPRAHGIYALHDHTKEIRYIGITLDDRDGFYGRVYKRHVTGSEERSHKFSHAYNTGRMWRDKKDCHAAIKTKNRFHIFQ